MAVSNNERKSNVMSPGRMRKVLGNLIDYLSVGESNSDVIGILLENGFTAKELVESWGFSKDQFAEEQLHEPIPEEENEERLIVRFDTDERKVDGVIIVTYTTAKEIQDAVDSVRSEAMENNSEWGWDDVLNRLPMDCKSVDFSTTERVFY